MTSLLVAILGAGESRRMGTAKLCLGWGGTTVLGHLLGVWREAGAGKILVIEPQDRASAVGGELDRLGVAAESRMATLAPKREMMGSVVTAAGRAAQDAALTHLVIALGDQPHLKLETLTAFLRVCGESPGKVVRVVHDGKGGHPLAVPACLFRDLSETSCATLRDFLGQQEIPVLDLTCADSGVLVDMDTPDDYAKISQL